MRRDIDEALRGWPYDRERRRGRRPRGPGPRRPDGRADPDRPRVLQMELDGRPDGSRPGGFAPSSTTSATGPAARRRRKPEFAGIPAAWAMGPEHCAEADRELVQFYHRRVALLALQRLRPRPPRRRAQPGPDGLHRRARPEPRLRRPPRAAPRRRPLRPHPGRRGARAGATAGPRRRSTPSARGSSGSSTTQDELNELSDPDDVPGLDPAEDSSDALLRRAAPTARDRDPRTTSRCRRPSASSSTRPSRARTTSGPPGSATRSARRDRRR